MNEQYLLPDLNTLQTWENPKVLRAFCHQYPQTSLQQAQQLFNDLFAWMWLTLYRKQHNKTTWLFGPLLILDDLWHCFILHTRDYHTFCQHFFGNYFHHDPEENNREHQLDAEELGDFLRDCFTYLGEPWVDRYFSHLC